MYVITGTWDDWGTDGILGAYMAKSVYDKIQSGEYGYRSTPYADLPIRVFNEAGKEIDLIEDKEAAHAKAD